MHFFRLDNKWLIWPLFLFMMGYAILRALFVEPLFDELVTLYWYIQTGYLPGRGATMDANNHILNSLVSHRLFRLFGDHFLVYRLFALSTFPLYFFACRKFLLRSATSFSILIFLALVSVHWIFDYFSFSRGYGPSLAFLMLAFCLVQQWLETFRSPYFAGIILSFIAALLCNLSLLIPLFILLCFLVLVSIVHFKALSRKQLNGFWLATLLFLGFLIPVYIYINKLKKAGALWWGSLDGLWEVTGKSISRNVFFSDHTAIKYLLIFLIVFIALTIILRWKNERSRNVLRDASWWVPALFIIVLAAIELSSRIMNVNYPMDRVGMYLVPLFILSFGFSVQRSKVLAWSLLLLLWFPLSFIFKINLDTSVFSPEDRIHRAFYQKIQKTVQADAVISADYVSQASYAYLTRNEKKPHIATDLLPGDSLSRGDYHISWIEKLHWPHYTCVLFDPVSSTRLYKRTTHFEKEIILDTVIPRIQSSGSVIPVLDLNLEPYLNQQLQTLVEGTVHLNRYCLDLNLRHEIESETKDSRNELRRTDNTRFNWYFGRKTNYAFYYPNHLISVLPEDRFLHIRFYNDDLNEVNLSAVRVKIVRVTEKFR